MWERLVDSSDAELAAIAAKALKEARYHEQHAGDWVVRLGDGTDESRQRMQAALAQLWRYAAELFTDDATDAAARASGLGPAWSELREPWQADSAFRSTGRNGVHSEHMGYILAEMQHLQRAYPGGVW
jgi:ring-1,2-phenylacetyl-CoA epoxidase subunit PaaC